MPPPFAEIERQWTWRPLHPDEIPYLEALAAIVSERRKRTRLSRAALAAEIGRSSRCIDHIERAERRTRIGTLERIADVLVRYSDLSRNELLSQMIGAAGPTIARNRGTFPVTPYYGRKYPVLDDHGDFTGYYARVPAPTRAPGELKPTGRRPDGVERQRSKRR
jgi:transcriptional regulator with XRE-family HTH domain